MKPDSGFITVDGHVLFDSGKKIFVPPRERKIGYVFQDYALFPHLTVRQNVSFGLHPLLFGRLSRAHADRVERIMDLFSIAPLAEVRPTRISGGQRQRVALARAMWMLRYGNSPVIILAEHLYQKRPCLSNTPSPSPSSFR